MHLYCRRTGSLALSERLTPFLAILYSRRTDTTLRLAPRRVFAHPWLWDIERANDRFAPKAVLQELISRQLTPFAVNLISERLTPFLLFAYHSRTDSIWTRIQTKVR